jgi:hypothetical protein
MSITFNVVENQLVRYLHDRPETAWDGFKLVDTGGNCCAYQHTFADGSYVWLTDATGCGVSELSDNNFSIGLYSADGEEEASYSSAEDSPLTIDHCLSIFCITEV